MYSPALLPSLLRKLRKLSRKDRARYETVKAKIDEIVRNPHHYKPLGNVMAGERRVHFGSFVLTFSVDEKTQIILFIDFDHHDKIYRN